MTVTRWGWPALKRTSEPPSVTATSVSLRGGPRVSGASEAQPATKARAINGTAVRVMRRLLVGRGFQDDILCGVKTAATWLACGAFAALPAAAAGVDAM